jgi:formylglycine-generating enzyme required for sulfatase activity
VGRFLFTALSLLIFGTFSPAWAENGDRIALVIGNSSYEHVDKLPNPEKDAGLIAETLRALGFTLVNGRAQVNLKEDEFRQAVKAFGEAAQHAQIALFYYAGHGVEQQNEENKNKNYLVPVDVPKNATVDSLIEIEFILRQMQRAAGLKVIVLDACRNNPFAEEERSLRLARGQDTDADRFRDLGAPKSGLAEMKIPPGTLMAFSTQPGDIAEDGRDGHSPYSRALAETMKQRGLTVWQVFNRTARKVEDESTKRKRPQVPWLSSSSIDDTIAFIAGSGGAIAVATAGEELPVVTPPANPATSSAAVIARQYEAHIAAIEQGLRAQGPTASPIPVGPLSAERERVLKPSDHFKECENCPEMVTLPPGTFVMGSPATEPGHQANEGPQNQIEFAGAFAVGRQAVTFDEWNACVADGGCNGYRPADFGWGGGKQPVINVSWNDAQAYVAWLSKKTGAPYRLLSEAEREYATRACTSTDCPSTPFWFGAEISPDRANYDWRRSYNGGAKAPQAALRTVASDASEPNPFGLLQVHGNVREWVADCWNPSLSGQPPDGAARVKGDCKGRVLRGGSWKDEPRDLRSAKRTWEMADERQPEIGFRVARTLRK